MINPYASALFQVLNQLNLLQLHVDKEYGELIQQYRQSKHLPRKKKKRERKRINSQFELNRSMNKALNPEIYG